ncbi:MAG: rRNA processing protein RimM [Acidobacteriaceae bacterium]|jgi:16S rRNA processing protein RimM|nr:rRNA processing protein RimM [Acidobacteriaceae bacterium]
MTPEDRDHDFVLLARLIRPQGRHGELLADVLTDFPERFAERTHVWLLPAQGEALPREADLERHWPHKGRIVLKFAGVDSINDAEPYRGWHVAIPRQQRAPLDEDAVYIGDLVGCRVYNETTASDLGPLLDVARGEGGAPDMLVLEQHGEELLIPFVKAFLVGIDLEARLLRMRLPPGLTEINAPLSEEERAAQQHTREEE